MKEKVYNDVRVRVNESLQTGCEHYIFIGWITDRRTVEGKVSEICHTSPEQKD